MKSSRLYEGDIKLNCVREIDEFGIPVKINGEFTSPHIQGKSFETITEKKRVLLVSFPNDNYVQLVKLKTLKDFINVYKEIIHGGSKYILKKDSDTYNTPYVTNLEPLNIKERHINVRRLVKNLYE